MTKVAFHTGIPFFDRDTFLTPFDKIFDQMIGTQFPDITKSVGVNPYAGSAYPKVNVYEYDDKVGIVAEIPGLDKKQLNVEVLDGDAVIAYRLEYIDNGLDVWTQLPHNFFFSEGTMQYVFTHTIGDVQFLIDGNYDLSNISTDYTDNQIFRYVLIPTEFAEQFNGDFSNYNEVMSALELNETDVQTLQ